ncbi:MAG: flagellar M-ring protein FliF C-terminal domain-containing protein, partial [Desulfatiglandales bacterium]
VIPVEPKEGALGGQLPESQDSTKTVNYEVSKTVRKVLEPAGVLKRISVAVVVDGTYKVTKTKKGETVEYVPRNEKELEAIKELVKGAINYNKERGDLVEVVNLPFQGKTAEKIEGPGLMERLREFSPYLRYLMALVIFFLIYSMVVKPVLNWLTKTPGVDVEIVKQLPLTVKEIEANYGAKQAALAERVRALLSEERDTAEKVVKSWLGETAP